MTILGMGEFWRAMAFPWKDFVRLLVLTLTTLAFCFLIYFVLYQGFHFSVVLQSMIPETFLDLTPIEKEETQKQIINDFQAQIKSNPEEITKKFYSLLLESPFLLFFQSLVWFLSFLLPGYFLLKKAFKAEVTDFSEELSAKTLVEGITNGFIIFCILLLVQVAFLIMQIKIQPGIFPELLFQSLSGNVYLLCWSVYCVGILTGIMEETFFRGFLLKQFIDKGLAKEGLLVVSILFGSMHYGPGTSIFVPFLITGVGMFFGYLYIKTNNIWISISCHATYNSLGLILAFFRLGVET